LGKPLGNFKAIDKFEFQPEAAEQDGSHVGRDLAVADAAVHLTHSQIQSPAKRSSPTTSHPANPAVHADQGAPGRRYMAEPATFVNAWTGSVSDFVQDSREA
jgi:hypothetical protein